MTSLLEVKHINKKFGNHIVLEDISFEINPGEIVGLVGRNGVGKTTLMKCILGLTKIDTGEMSFKETTEYFTNKSMMDQIGYLLDCKLFENLNAYENIKIQEWYKGKHYTKAEEKKVIEDVLKLVDLKNDHKKVKAYSFGMKQRLGLALALLGDTKLLILDEPFVGLDPVGIQTIREFILRVSTERNMAILISSHQLSEIEGICGRYLLLSERNIEEYKQDERKKVILYTEQELPCAIKHMMQDKEYAIEEQMISFWFDEKLLNHILKYFVENNITIKDIELKKMSLETLFRRAE